MRNVKKFYIYDEINKQMFNLIFGLRMVNLILLF